MKRPDEIKKGLEYLSIKDVVKKLDMWKEGIAYDYTEDAAADALAYIQQLEAERDALATALQRCDLDCDYCKHSAIPNPSCEAMNMDCMSCDADCPCKSCLDNSNWQWRGVQMGIPMLDKKTVSQCISADYCRGWNDAVDAVPRWISVEERLPEKHTGVIACCEDGYIAPMEYDGRHWNWNGKHEDSVTHWMPLPEPPKEETT